MTDTTKDCSLCGLPIQIVLFTMPTKQGEKIFCCEGCVAVFKLLKADLLLPEPNPKPDSKSKKK